MTLLDAVSIFETTPEKPRELSPPFFEKIRDSALGTFVLYIEFDRNKLISAGFRIFLLRYGQNVKDLGNKVVH